MFHKAAINERMTIGLILSLLKGWWIGFHSNQKDKSNMFNFAMWCSAYSMLLNLGLSNENEGLTRSDTNDFISTEN